MVEDGDRDVERALRILVQHSVEKFGFAPRDVYRGVFTPLELMGDHRDVLRSLSFTELRRLIQKVNTEFAFEKVTHRVIAVRPITFTPSRDRWKINFKSIWIAEQMVGLMAMEEARHLRETCDLLYQVPASASMAGWYFEAFGHRILNHGWDGLDGPVPQPTRMTPDDSEAPTFTASHSSPPDTSHGPISSIPRTPKRVNLDAKILDAITLENNIYYTPSKINNPLFISFTIHYDPEQQTVVISIFQSTISPSHEGSPKGLTIIRKIIKHVKGLLKDTEHTVKVAYFLVCLKRKSKNTWKMPPGWNDNAKVNDHRGEFFCIGIPVLGLGASYIYPF
jgi:hypothetical protein